ncbi:hypothetical protein SJAG_00625 [Schizosaccharomyces japonicus yFS275]|uniref:Uncharacterized protein n=1 Tax=Schizosaccharomyces japonicus (strain yFS275 / FY16936) TaxID=402676 RepID=B6JW55_SCHJY|nr:hypothetical protein SJAG_00625 [Schizosaccharomyces japonicus yFS275]EEB05606.1 hypothetical protein SJAG_00625 [Schizosaccharomyces japonicus yFS275]
MSSRSHYLAHTNDSDERTGKHHQQTTNKHNHAHKLNDSKDQRTLHNRLEAELETEAPDNNSAEIGGPPPHHHHHHANDKKETIMKGQLTDATGQSDLKELRDYLKE